jgi:hypothetical protein
MNGYTTLADRVASLLPNTTAGACVPSSPMNITARGRDQMDSPLP